MVTIITSYFGFQKDVVSLCERKVIDIYITYKKLCWESGRLDASRESGRLDASRESGRLDASR